MSGRPDFDFGDIDKLTFAGLLAGQQRGQDARSGAQSGLIATLRQGHGQRLPGGVAGADGHAAGAAGIDVIGFPVLVRAGLAERGDGNHHQFGINGFQNVVTEPQAVHAAADIILDKHVGVGDEFFEDFFALRLVQIKGDALFIGIEGEVEAAFLGVGMSLGKGPLIRASSPAGFFDLDDFGAETGQ